MISTNLVNLSIGPIADHLDELEDPCRILKSRVTGVKRRAPGAPDAASCP